MQQRQLIFLSLLFSGFLLALLTGCGFVSQRFSNEPNASQGRENSASLSQVHAELRSSIIDRVDYELMLDLTKTDQFTGRVVIQLQVNRTDHPLTIDFNEGTVGKTVLNEKPVQLAYNGHFLTIPAIMLHKGQNTLEVDFQHLFSTDGNGLFRFIDPEDQRTYLYSNFEPYSANRMFPVLDQPDLKATFKLSTKVPDDWQVFSAQKERRIARTGNTRWWYFPASDRISSYVFSVHAGPYEIWEDTQFRIPLRLMARKSQKHKVQSEEWFRLTRLAFNYYEKYFDYPYPYTKYDQLILPELGPAGMENVAAVTFDESLLSESLSEDPFHPHRMLVSEVIFHEMAHMWLGNLVTIKWWNDLWLKEGFASFMSYMTMEYGASLPGWLYFNLESKANTYDKDRLASTHSVDRPIASTGDAEANFDDITYGKAAATLQQLQVQLGSDVFQQAVREYIQLHQGGSTQLTDFTSALESPSGLSMDHWAKEWLTTSGVNEIRAKYSCKKGYLQKLELLQMPAKTGTQKKLREQKITIALLNLKNNKLQVRRELTTTYNGKKTNVEIVGRHPCPVMVYPNSNDQAYALVRLDDESRNTVLKYPADSPLLRNLIMQSLKEDLGEGVISLPRYAERLMTLLEQETNSMMIDHFQQTLKTVFYLSRLVKPENDKARKTLDDLAQHIEDLSWQQTDLTVDDTSQSWFDIWTSVAHTKEALTHIANILDGKKAFNNFTLQQYQRWQMIKTLNGFNWPDAEQRIARELKKDGSEEGQQYAIAAKAIRPSLENKRYWINELLNPDKLRSPSVLDAISDDLFPVNQIKQSRFLAQEIFSFIPQVAQKDHGVQEQFGKLLVNECSAEGIRHLDQTIEKYHDFSSIILNALKDNRQQTERCISMSENILH